MASRTSPNTIRIHVGHPLGRSTQPVRDLVDALDGLGGGAVAASCSASLPLDQHWQARTGEALRAADILLLVFGERPLERDWWLWEAGFVAALGPSDARRTICLHHPDLDVPRPLRAWRTVPCSRAHAEALLREILGARISASGKPLIAGIEGKGLRWLTECLVRCCATSGAPVPIDPLNTEAPHAAHTEEPRAGT